MRPLVILPTYNEREDVRRLVPRLLDIPGLRVLVLDDMSPDGTGFAAEVLAEHSDGRVSVVHRTGRPRGVGRASLDGIRRALETDADVICQLDASLSHPPEDLVAMLDAAQRADLVIGTRGDRSLLSAAANLYVRALCGIGVRDCTSSVRCWRRDALAALPLRRIDCQGSAGLVHMLYEAIVHGCVVTEVPLTAVDRPRRQSRRPRFAGELVALPWKLLSARAATTAAASAPPAALRAVDNGPR